MDLLFTILLEILARLIKPLLDRIRANPWMRKSALVLTGLAYIMLIVVVFLVLMGMDARDIGSFLAPVLFSLLLSPLVFVLIATVIACLYGVIIMLDRFIDWITNRTNRSAINPDDQAKFDLARNFIHQKNYPEARYILLTINHPKAREWEKKLDQMGQNHLLHPRHSKSK